jgi:hypothetical protein
MDLDDWLIDLIPSAASDLGESAVFMRHRPNRSEANAVDALLTKRAAVIHGRRLGNQAVYPDDLTYGRARLLHGHNVARPTAPAGIRRHAFLPSVGDYDAR